ncbi:hypothetical protein [Actinoplanes sp. HUAS TT8]|uniref:hypothetical protein n=1 Tax=Actinoplanes sp. HUAS TT8 TaxID=3447453 RepID=UPI003F522860
MSSEQDSSRVAPRSSGQWNPARLFGPTADEADDRTVAGLLAYHALVEIRASARKPSRQPETSTAEVLESISFLADLVHNLPLVARSQRPWRYRRPRPANRREQAMQARPMSWTWNAAGESGRQWMLRHIANAGFRWAPPPPLPIPVKNFADWNLRRRLQVLTGWPVRTPSGRRPLPKAARVLKALGRDQMYALYEEAGRRRLGLGSSSAALYTHLDPEARHYLFPDPAEHYWPGDDRPWWQCRVLLRMVDGEQITGSLAVLPETFSALPSNVSRMRQRRLVLTARMLERDFYLWHQEHEAVCSPHGCGYSAEPIER